MTDDQHGEGTPQGGGRWDPLPQGDYDDGATAFVKLPEGGVDALLAGAETPLAAPGHGYVPPQITVTPATTAGTDPAATGTWAAPGAPVDGAQWHDPHGTAPQHGGDAAHQQHDADTGARQHTAHDRFTYNPGATGQWHFEEAAAAETPAPGHDVTGQWSIPVAGGDLPDESGEFTTSALVEQWGGTPPATLPGGAPAPWATQAAGRPWGQEVPQGGAPSDQAGAGHGHEQPGAAHGNAHEQPGAGHEHARVDHGHGHAGPTGHAPDQPAAPHIPGQTGPGAPAREQPTAGYAPEPPGFADHAPHPPAEPYPNAAAEPREESYGEPGEGSYGGGREESYGERQEGPHGEAHESYAEPHEGPHAEAGEESYAEPHTEPGGPEAPQPAQEASQPAPGAGEPSEGPEDAQGAPEAADGPTEPADSPAGPAPAGTDAEAGPDAGNHPAPSDHPTTATDARTPDEPGPTDEPSGAAHEHPEGAPAAGPHESAGTPDDQPPAPPREEHPLASYVLRVNGTDRPVTDAWIGESLLYVLRERLGLAGAKDGCSQGECGACNVQVDGRLVASCLVPAVTAAGSEVRTVEGLAEDGQPSDVQRALARCGAVQCGFCVPGMAMTVHDLLEGNPAPTELETRQALCGNLCRCSGYRGVVEAVKEVVAEREAHTSSGETETDAAEPRIPHQAGPGAGGVNPSAFGSPGPPSPAPDSPPPHDRPYGQDGGHA